MPLRVTDESDKSFEAKKKVHRKMSKNGHYQKVRRPTGLEVYTDAARILEELLERRIDEDVRVGNCARRNKSDPTRDVIRSPQEGGGSTNAVTRCKTMPSRYRESSKEEELEKKDLDRLRDTAALGRKKSKEHGSDSSMDTADEDVSENGAKRRKKSRFKRAVERLKHVFNRDQKEGFGSIPNKDSSAKSPSSDRKKPRHKLSKILVSEKKRHIKAHKESEVDLELTEEQDYKDKHGSKHTKLTSVKHGNKNAQETLEFTLSQDLDGHRQISASGIKFPADGHQSLPSSVIHKPPYAREDNQEYSRDSSTWPSPQSSSHQNPSSGLSRPTSLRHKKDSLESKSSSLSPHKTLSSILKTDVDADGHDGTPTSSTSHGSRDLGSPNMNSSRSNVLDSPGEDIEFMDDITSTTFSDNRDKSQDTHQSQGSSSDLTRQSAHSTPVKYHGSKGLLDMTWLADQTANGARLQDLELEETSVTSLRPDGALEVTTTLEVRQTVILPDVIEEEVDGAVSAVEDGPTQQAEKEAMYSRVAQRLAEMADSYAQSFSDHESRGASVVTPPVALSHLENEIIRCLRSSGDRNSRQVDAAVAEVAEESREEAYNRFRSTVQNSLGRELSWDYLAFLFYTTKGVVSAVGKGTHVASQAKEFTLQYISDTCASWLIDHGGFDSMLSETEETDFELD
ncbi:hypothetical protein ElyMa_000482100 [Elysia marginata]|uniref:Uncharacterized protein n=1 Tax=Elysia marginata TaxID=1093978 RepID=A0AAV4FTT7_9GAST|nr:hypothetical protein ElyMa_000482100 [Elysia marginata]